MIKIMLLLILLILMVANPLSTLIAGGLIASSAGILPWCFMIWVVWHYYNEGVKKTSIVESYISLYTEKEELLTGSHYEQELRSFFELISKAKVKSLELKELEKHKHLLIEALNIIDNKKPQAESALDKLSKLQSLLESGAITDSEFQEQKNKLLKRI